MLKHYKDFTLKYFEFFWAETIKSFFPLKHLWIFLAETFKTFWDWISLEFFDVKHFKVCFSWVLLKFILRWNILMFFICFFFLAETFNYFETKHLKYFEIFLSLNILKFSLCWNDIKILNWNILIFLKQFKVFW